MKKRICVMALCVMLLITGCSMSGKTAWKNFKADMGNGLDREITVTHALTGEQLWHYDGKCYITDSSTRGDITIIYYCENEPMKVDFIGDHFIVKAIEK